MTNKELAQRFIDTLNELVEIDGHAIEKLILHRVRCNEELANHPTVQVRENTPFKTYSVGMLGLLNGLVGIQDNGWGYIAAVFNVECPKCGEETEDYLVGDQCPNCGCELGLGSLVRFELVNNG